MSDKVFDYIQMGKETVRGTAGTVDINFPGKTGEPELDRGYLNPEEDYGGISDAHAGRGSMGVRGASTTLDSDVRFEDVLHLFEMHLATAGAPTGANPYVYTHTADETSDTVTTYTMEVGATPDANDQYRLTGCVIPELAIGFDALSAPGNAPWTQSSQVEAFNRIVSAQTGAVNPPTVLETAEGHLTQLFEGPVATAFASLDELAASLVSFRLTSTRPFSRRVYGTASADVATDWGLSEKASATFEAGIKISSTSKGNIHDIYAAAGSPITERRWRVKVNGSSLATQNEVQVATLSVAGGASTGGTFTLQVLGSTTAPLAYNISANDLQTALRATASINGAHCTVAGSAGGPYTVTFMGALASTSVPIMLASGAALTGAGSPYTVTVTRTTNGGLLKSIILDGRVRFTVVGRGDRDGESIYIVQGAYVKDATTGSRLQVITTNGVSSIA